MKYVDRNDGWPNRVRHGCYLYESIRGVVDSQRLDNRSLVIRRACFVLSIDNRFERIKGKANSSMKTIIKRVLVFPFLSLPLFATFDAARQSGGGGRGDKYRLKYRLLPIYALVYPCHLSTLKANVCAPLAFPYVFSSYRRKDTLWPIVNRQLVISEILDVDNFAIEIPDNERPNKDLA